LYVTHKLITWGNLHVGVKDQKTIFRDIYRIFKFHWHHYNLASSFHAGASTSRAIPTFGESAALFSSSLSLSLSVISIVFRDTSPLCFPSVLLQTSRPNSRVPRLGAENFSRRERASLRELSCRARRPCS